MITIITVPENSEAGTTQIAAFNENLKQECATAVKNGFSVVLQGCEKTIKDIYEKVKEMLGVDYPLFVGNHHLAPAY